MNDATTKPRAEKNGEGRSIAAMTDKRYLCAVPCVHPLSIDGLMDWLPSRAFWADFLTSSGFAGLMAVLAASIAGFFVSRQLRQARRQHADERWWESLKWTYSLIGDGESAGGKSIGPDISVSLLLALQHDANQKHGTQLQRSTIGALAAVFSTAPESDPATGPMRTSTENQSATTDVGSSSHTKVNPPGTGAGEVEEPDASVDFHNPTRVTISQDASDQLRSLLESAKDESPQARSRLFELKVQDALTTANPELSLVRSSADRGFDLLVGTERGPVAIEVKAWRKEQPASVIRNVVSHLDSAVRSSGFAGGVVVIQAPDVALANRHNEAVAAKIPANIVVLEWNGRDSETLLDAVRRAAGGSQSG